MASAGTGRLTRTAVIERFGGCCCGGRVVRGQRKKQNQHCNRDCPQRMEQPVRPAVI